MSRSNNAPHNAVWRSQNLVDRMIIWNSISRDNDLNLMMHFSQARSRIFRQYESHLPARTESSNTPIYSYMLKAMIELTMSLSFSFNALIALFRETLAWVITSSISLSSRPSASTSSPSSSSSSFLSSPVSISLPLPWECPWAEWSWPEWSCPE